MKTVKNRKRKFALGMKIAALCSCLALASVGFASWLVVQEPEDKTLNGSVEVALTAEAKLLVDELAVKQTLETNIYAKKFSFGKPATLGVPVNWLLPIGVEEQDLAEEYTLKFKPQKLPANTKVKFTLNFNGVVNGVVNTERLALLISKGYLTLTVNFGNETVVYNDAKEGENFTHSLPAEGASITHIVEWSTLEAAQTAETEDAQSISLPLTIQFAWGSAFGTKNPYEYYNSIANPSLEQTSKAYDVLADLASIVKGLSKEAIKAGTVTESTETPNALSYKVLIDAELDLSAVTY